MERKTIYRDWGGLRRTFATDESEPGRSVYFTEQDITAIIDSIARDQDIMAQNGDARLSHRIPTIIYEDLQRKGITEDPDEFRKWLNGPEGRPWRVYKGTV